MKILALDSSGLVASVAVVEDEKLLAEYTVNYKKTHSQTLLPMLDEIGKMIDLDLSAIDAIAVVAGRDPLPVFGSVPLRQKVWDLLWINHSSQCRPLMHWLITFMVRTSWSARSWMPDGTRFIRVFMLLMTGH